jgi:hypothetical protein
MDKMRLNYKIISTFLGIVVVVLVATVVVLWLRSPVQPVSTSNFVSTPVQDEYTQAFITYVAQLEQEELVTVKEIRVEESQPFIFILKPQNSQEITDQDVLNIIDLALRTVSVFESRGGLHDDDLDIAFHRPVEQKILLIKRRNMPELLSADVYGEITISIDKRYFTSLINLSGPPKNGRQDFANAWSVIQATCSAYAGDFPAVDPVCNIISANAAAGWVGIEQEHAAEVINSYGMTQLGYLGNKDYRYRFINFVYEEFIR